MTFFPVFPFFLWLEIRQSDLLTVARRVPRPAADLTPPIMCQMAGSAIQPQDRNNPRILSKRIHQLFQIKTLLSTALSQFGRKKEIERLRLA